MLLVIAGAAVAAARFLRRAEGLDGPPGASP
jgi:hypothetical protein